ncbi:MAG TPA: RNA polymerase sigma factor [Xanthobacteraceae bacterium]|jgi:RNA polymerase sigma factor (sigma-70 family)|nr:RNA polymerase sigma factor [Xanthobacteraceae bacterium]
MSSSGREALRQAFAFAYDELRRRLTHRLGSVELASDALHDAWLRLDRAQSVGVVRSPTSYLLQIGFNAALKRRAADRRALGLADAGMALGIADETPDPEQAMIARSEVEALGRALAEMPPRRRDILLASRLEGLTMSEIAQQLGVSLRLAELELQHALAHCAQRLNRQAVQRFGPRSSGGSHKSGEATRENASPENDGNDG